MQNQNLIDMREYTKIDDFQVIQQVGHGMSSIIMTATDKEGEKVALKIFKDSEINSFQNEYFAYDHLNHHNFLAFKGANKKCAINKNQNISYIVLEYADKGDMFGHIEKGGLGEQISKFYMIQLMDALLYINSKGYAHRDIKPENILLDANYDLKIADFGYLTRIISKNPNGMHSSRVGTCIYMAPEIYENRYYDPSVSDVFSLGVLLFSTVTGRPPFYKQVRDDFYYRFLYKEVPETFWNLHNRTQKFDLSEELKDLIVQMLKYDPNKRIKITEILGHKWFSEQKMTQSMVKSEMETRFG